MQTRREFVNLLFNLENYRVLLPSEELSLTVEVTSQLCAEGFPEVLELA